MTKYKEGRYTYYIVPEQKLIKCVSTYAKKPIIGWAKCADSDEFNEEVGKTIARVRCDAKINKKRVAFLHELCDYYFDAIQYNSRKHGQICAKLREADRERRNLTIELKKIEDM